MEKIKIQKNSVQETLVLPLYGRAYCAEKYGELFSDPLSAEVIERIDYDFETLNFKEFQIVTWAVRQRMLMDKVKAYLKDHPAATIIDLGCGLATGFPTVDNGQCSWINLDLPDVIAIREQLLPCGERERNIAADAFDLSWIEQIEADPKDGIYVISGGVFYYFKPEKLKILFNALAKKFPGGGLYFDCESSYGVKKSNKMVEKSGNKGAKMYFSVDDANALFTSWSSYFKQINVVSRLPEEIQKSRNIPFKIRFILKLGCAMGIMKFVEIRF